MLMIAFITLSLARVGLAQHADDNSLINDPEHIKSLNEYNKKSTWTAKANPFFDGLTYNDARAYLGTSLLDVVNLAGEVRGDSDSHYPALKDKVVPASFNSRDEWRELIHDVRSQKKCGSCWAIAAADVLSDRISIATKKHSPTLSAEDLLSCDSGVLGPYGCWGGRIPQAWSYFMNTGIVSEHCFPYAAQGGKAPACPKKCRNSETWSKSKVRASSAYAIYGITNMQKEIMTNGPIQGALWVYKSFVSYDRGVYQKHWYEMIPLGGHSVRIGGWGTEDSTDYWFAANSWDNTWGYDGWFRIRRGVNECGIEAWGYAGMPSLQALNVSSEAAVLV